MVDEATNVNDDRPVILLVEDEALTIMDLGDVLENGGYETVQCASAERALGIIQARPDICGLITDVELSGKTNGFELATAVSATTARIASRRCARSSAPMVRAGVR